MSDFFELYSIADIKKQLPELRKAGGWTQAKLAERLGVRQPRIAEIEANPGAVSLEQFLKILDALGVRLGVKPAPDKPGGPVAPNTPNKAKASNDL